VASKERLRDFFADQTRVIVSFNLWATKPKPISFHLATYNVHKCRGMDGRTRPSRIASVLKGLKADVVAFTRGYRYRSRWKRTRRGDRSTAEYGIGAGLGSNLTAGTYTAMVC